MNSTSPSLDARNAIVARLRALLRDPDAFVPLHAPEFKGPEWEFVKDCLDTGWVSSVGKYVDQFEQEVADLCGAKYGVAVVNGTAALQISMLVGGVVAGDEVLMPALTFVATANAACHGGAIPHFVDSCPKTMGIDPKALRDYLAEIADCTGGQTINRKTGRRIAAIVPMHVFGHPVDMDALNDVARDYGLLVVEDAAESLGSTYKNRPCGSLGDIATLSFNGNKIITTGGGGAIVTNNEDFAKRAKYLTTTAKVPHRWAFDHSEVAYNYRMPNINAALGCAQLTQLQDRIAQKRQLAQHYIAGFSDLKSVAVFQEPEHAQSNYWLNALILDPALSASRDDLLDALNAADLMCRPVWTLMHHLPMFTDCPRSDLPVAEDLATRVINIPSSAHLGQPSA